MPKDLSKRPAKYQSSAAHVADMGKYQPGADVAPDQNQSTDDMRIMVGIRNLTRRGLRVLVVGSPPGTFPQWMAKHKSVLLWPSSEASNSDALRQVPGDVGAVAVTRMLSHALSENVLKQARARALMIIGPSSPGGVRRIVETALVQEIAAGDPVPGGVAIEASPKQPLDLSDGMGPIDYVEPAPVEIPPVVAEPVEALASDPQQLANTLQLIDDTVAALSLVREAVTKLAADAERNREQAETLARLRALLK